PIGKNFTANASCENSTHNERDAVLDTELVYEVARRLVVSRKHNYIGIANLLSQVRIFHDVRVYPHYVDVRIPIPEYFGDGINLLSTDKTSTADMADNIFRPENI